MTESAQAPLTLEVLSGEYSIHRLPPDTTDASAQRVIEALLQQNTTLFSLLKSDNELSLVCDAALTINTAEGNTSSPWRALRVTGQLDFALTGILAGLTTPLASAGISVFALSSFDTDYLLVNSTSLDGAVACLQAAGNLVITSDNP